MINYHVGRRKGKDNSSLIDIIILKIGALHFFDILHEVKVIGYGFFSFLVIFLLLF